MAADPSEECCDFDGPAMGTAAQPENLQPPSGGEVVVKTEEADADAFPDDLEAEFAGMGDVAFDEFDDFPADADAAAAADAAADEIKSEIAEEAGDSDFEVDLKKSKKKKKDKKEEKKDKESEKKAKKDAKKAKDDEKKAKKDEKKDKPSPKTRVKKADEDEVEEVVVGEDEISEDEEGHEQREAEKLIWDEQTSLREDEKWKLMLSQVAAEEGDDLVKELAVTDYQDKSVEDSKPASKQLLDSITIARTRDIAPHCQLFFFKSLAVGSFVRAVCSPGKPPKYALFEVVDAIPTGIHPETGAALVYKVNDVPTDWLLVCKTGTHTRKIKLSQVSDNRCTDDEYVQYVKRMEKHGLPIATKKRVVEKRNRIWKIYADYYQKELTEEQVQEIVTTRARLRGSASVNLVRNKLVLQEQLEELASRRLQEELDEGKGIQPEELVGVEDSEAAWMKHYQDQFEKKRHLELELVETEEKLQSVLNGQNSTLGTLAALTHRNAAGNKERMQAEDPIDAIVFGRKQGRSETYWSVSEGGFGDKQQMIERFWKDRSATETAERDELDQKRASELKAGTLRIKDVASLIRDSTKEGEGSSQASAEQQATQSSQAAKKRKRDGQDATPGNAPKRRLALADFLKKCGE